MNAVQDVATNKILIVDDNAQIHADFCKILLQDSTQANAGEIEPLLLGENSASSAEPCLRLSLSHAYQAEEAIGMVESSMAENQPFDIAFVDMRMPPGWDGLKTVKELWKVDPQLQIIICTAYSDHSSTDVIASIGQTDKLLIFKKPFDSIEVHQLVSALTRKGNLAKLAASRLIDAEESVEVKTEELRQANQDAEQLLHAISSIVIEIDGEGFVSRWNTTAERVFSIASTNAIGCNVNELPICWRDPDSIAKVTGAHKKCDRQLQSREFDFYDANDSLVIVGLTGYPVVTPGQPNRFLILGIDLTEQRKVERQLSAAQKHEAVGQLAAGVAHEINTPMQYIGDNVSYVKRSFETILEIVTAYQRIVAGFKNGEILGSLPKDAVVEIDQKKLASLIDQIPEALNDSEEGIAQVSKIVSAMNQFSHPGQEIKTQVDLNEVLESAIRVASNEWKYVANVVRDFDETLPSVEALHSELNQVFLNLIVNAAHAIAEEVGEQNQLKGTINISTRECVGFAEVLISDTGTGIPDEIKDRVFDPFFTTKALGKGTGQGLAIAHQAVVTRYNGEFDFESKPDNGTVFTIRIPFSHVDSNERNGKLGEQDACSRAC